VLVLSDLALLALIPIAAIVWQMGITTVQLGALLVPSIVVVALLGAAACGAAIVVVEFPDEARADAHIDPAAPRQFGEGRYSRPLGIATLILFAAALVIAKFAFT
jgi:hypothetical protein